MIASSSLLNLTGSRRIGWALRDSIILVFCSIHPYRASQKQRQSPYSVCEIFISLYLLRSCSAILSHNRLFKLSHCPDTLSRSTIADTSPFLSCLRNLFIYVITAKPKAHAFKNEMCFPLTKTKCELKKHPNSKFECFFNDFNRTKTSLFLPFPSKLIQDNLVCVLELQE